MWEQYRRTALPIQCMILLICLLLWFVLKIHPVAIVVFLVVMELGALIGAAWGARLKRKVNAKLDSLPLRR